MIDVQRAAGLTSILGAIFSIAALAVGLNLLAATGGRSAVDLTDPAALRQVDSLVIAAEALKIAMALAAVVTVFGVGQRLRNASSRLAQPSILVGLLAAFFLLLAGVLGILAISGALGSIDAQSSLPTSITLLGFISVAITGVWALLVGTAGRQTNTLPRTLAAVSGPYAFFSIATLFMPFMSFLTLVVSLVWAIWLGMVLLRGA